MSYFKTLDEQDHEVLCATLRWRAKNIAEGKCDYCERPLGAEPACKFPKRHEGNHWQDDELMHALVMDEIQARMFREAKQVVAGWSEVFRTIGLVREPTTKARTACARHGLLPAGSLGCEQCNRESREQTN